MGVRGRARAVELGWKRVLARVGTVVHTHQVGGVRDPVDEGEDDAVERVDVRIVPPVVLAHDQVPDQLDALAVVRLDPEQAGLRHPHATACQQQ